MITENDYESDAREATWAASCGFRSAADYYAASREAFEEEQWSVDNPYAGEGGDEDFWGSTR